MWPDPLPHRTFIACSISSLLSAGAYIANNINVLCRRGYGLSYHQWYVWQFLLMVHPEQVWLPQMVPQTIYSVIGGHSLPQMVPSRKTLTCAMDPFYNV